MHLTRVILVELRKHQSLLSNLRDQNLVNKCNKQGITTKGENAIGQKENAKYRENIKKLEVNNRYHEGPSDMGELLYQNMLCWMKGMKGVC